MFEEIWGDAGVANRGRSRGNLIPGKAGQRLEGSRGDSRKAYYSSSTTSFRGRGSLAKDEHEPEFPATADGRWNGARTYPLSFSQKEHNAWDFEPRKRPPTGDRNLRSLWWFHSDPCHPSASTMASYSNLALHSNIPSHTSSCSRTTQG